MSTTVGTIQTKTNQFIRDSSVDSISAASRLSAISIAVQDLMTELNLEQAALSYDLDYCDGITDYNLTADLTNFLEPVDLVREVGYNDTEFVRKSLSEMRVEISNNSGEQSFALEKVDAKTIFVINNINPRHSYKQVDPCNGLISNGSWLIDAVDSDALNLTVDNNEYKTSTGSFNFDIDVSQSANNKATIYNSTLAAEDWSNYEDLASIIFWAYLPTVTNFTSFTIYWGSSTAAYWIVTATTDYTGNAFTAGWNRVKVNWNNAVAVGAPNSSAITYMAIDFNYAVGQGDDTDYRIDDIRIVRPEKIRLLYQSWMIGTTDAGVELSVFTATNDIPFYSGQYDFYDNYVAHKAASLLFQQMGLYTDSSYEEAQAKQIKEDLGNRFKTTAKKVETRSFKIHGLSFPRKGRRR